MLTEPLTLPPLRKQQLVYAAIVAVFFAWPLLFGAVQLGNVSLFGGQEWALLVGNLFAFVCGQRRGIRLTFLGRRQLTPTSYEFEFTPRHPVRQRAGQYMELTLPHRRADVRGIRRVFSMTSGPEDPTVRFGIKFADPGSTFKTALLALEPGADVRATAVAGDFLLPKDSARPLLMVAGGIGITPFVSQLAARGVRDVVLVHALRDAAELSYVEELAASGARVVVVAPERPAPMPADWTFVQAPAVTEQVLAAAVPDVGSRQAYVSGSR